MTAATLPAGASPGSALPTPAAMQQAVVPNNYGPVAPAANGFYSPGPNPPPAQPAVSRAILAVDTGFSLSIFRGTLAGKQGLIDK